MRPAAVGFHCPEEQNGRGGQGDGQERRRSPRTVLGGRVPGGRPGVVTQVLIGLCVLAYFLQGAPGVGGGNRPNEFTADFSLYGPAIAIGDEYYRLVTAAFLHASLLHIIFNMIALYLLGYQLEAVLGRARYLALFVVSAVGGNTFSYVMSGVDTYSVGASTAVFGFFSAFYVIARRLRADTSQILIVVGLNLVITFTISGIDRWGHLGGLATGLVLGVLYSYVPPRKPALQAAGVAAVLVGLLAVAVTKTSAIGYPDLLVGLAAASPLA
jgi:membrane associated rhomboid family serine protease